jgi:hypothetical protein
LLLKIQQTSGKSKEKEWKIQNDTVVIGKNAIFALKKVQSP